MEVRFAGCPVERAASVERASAEFIACLPSCMDLSSCLACLLHLADILDHLRLGHRLLGALHHVPDASPPSDLIRSHRAIPARLACRIPRCPATGHRFANLDELCASLGRLARDGRARLQAESAALRAHLFGPKCALFEQPVEVNIGCHMSSWCSGGLVVRH